MKLNKDEKGRDANPVNDNQLYLSHYNTEEIGLYFFFQNYQNCKEDFYGILGSESLSDIRDGATVQDVWHEGFR